MVSDSSTSLSPDQARTGLRILVADDDPVNRRLYSMLLGKSGHEAHVVEDGKGALEALAGERFDLVILDYSMPGLDGPETARRIRRGDAGQDGAGLTILAVTGYADGPEHQVCLDAGMDGVLVKPLTLTDLEPWLSREA